MRRHLQGLQEPTVFHQLGRDVIQLRHADNRRLPHVWVVILHAIGRCSTAGCLISVVDAQHTVMAAVRIAQRGVDSGTL